ncbi:MAG TPA: hypothetical protein VGM69_21270 [Chloroflexota bacterium]|jgi:aspartate kinase
MLVMKFGGSSILGGRHLRAVAEIVAGHRAARPVVVASATREVTERLLAAANAAAAGERRLPRRTVLALEEEHAEAIWSALDGRTARAEACRGVAGRLFRLDAALADVRASGRLTPEARDRIVGAGEGCLVPILAAALRQRGLPARVVDTELALVTGDRFGAASADPGATTERAARLVRPLVAAGTVPVLGGYDLSASILGHALDAREVRIWGDVSGVVSAAPTRPPSARPALAVS